MTIGRRTALKGMIGAAAGVAAMRFPVAHAQNRPVKVGLLTVKTGPLASGGIQMEQGLTAFLKSKNMMLAGRKIELFSEDTGGNPAGAKTKAQELVERDQVDFVCGPLAAFELLAITNYMQAHKIPMMSLAGADDMTQRKPNPYFIRASATSSQACHVMGDYAAKEMKLKNVATIVEDFAFGYEQAGGFQQVFEDDGGRVVKKLWPPLVTPDYTPYLAQLTGIDGVWQGFAGSNPLKFMKQYADFGLKDKYPICGGETAGDDALLPHFGDEAIGLVTACPYSVSYDSPSNKTFVATMARDYHVVPGQYSAILYINGMIIEETLKKLGGNLDDKEKTIEAMRSVSLADSPRGPFHFDHLGNVVGNIFVRKIEKKDGKLVNTILKTYQNVGQFWPYKEKEYLAHPVYSRNYPPLKG